MLIGFSPEVAVLHHIIEICEYLRNLHIGFHSIYTNLSCHQKCISVSFYLYNHQHWLLLGIMTIATLTDVWWYLIVVLVYISLMVIYIHYFEAFINIITSIRKFESLMLAGFLFFHTQVYFGHQYLLSSHVNFAFFFYFLKKKE